ncbi:MAG: 3-deoxy-8-phosphooctulonate synthase [Anaerolineae bacterium]|nr:3-deoxy-8-phosphooctulonate synthase [Anaerolineae bacterium]
MAQMVCRLTDDIVLGGDNPVLIAGPCVVESYETTQYIARRLKEIAQETGLPFVFKASFDKANRTSISSFRSLGFELSLEILRRVRAEVQVPVLTDVHETAQVDTVAAAVDVLQIPAFLCRQTDLLGATGRTGLPVNIKRGQFMAPEDMQYAVEKVTSTGNTRVFLTERGSSFGYHNLVVDMRALPTMRQYAPVVFDVTHSVQQPGGAGGASGGQRQFGPYLARAAAAVGVDGFFIETHPNPAQALSDGPNMIPLDELPDLLTSILVVWRTARPFFKPLGA